MLSNTDKNGPMPQPHMAAPPKRTISQGFIGFRGSKTMSMSMGKWMKMVINHGILGYSIFRQTKIDQNTSRSNIQISPRGESHKRSSVWRPGRIWWGGEPWIWTAWIWFSNSTLFPTCGTSFIWTVWQVGKMMIHQWIWRGTMRYPLFSEAICWFSAGCSASGQLFGFKDDKEAIFRSSCLRSL